MLPALGRSSSFNSNGGSSSTGASKQAGGSRRTSGTQQPQATLLGRQLSRSSNSFNASHDSGSSSAGGGGLGAQLTAQQQLSGVQLAVLGPGSMLGENVLGYNPEEVSQRGFREWPQAVVPPHGAITGGLAWLGNQLRSIPVGWFATPMTTLECEVCDLASVTCLYMCARFCRTLSRPSQQPVAAAHGKPPSPPLQP